MNQSAEEFFKQYEKAILEPDVALVAALYADTFMFGGPQGVQSIKKDDFLKVVPRRKEYFAAIGLLDSRVVSINEMSLDAKYLLVRIVWLMTFKKRMNVKETLETKATYILERKGETLVIIFQIDHQDLTAKVNEQGLV